ncbi:hypothetical protein Leryth_010632 [Lithospermum erythrorhizon]|nr:hypothetical protein Leryth_010632 [Lithospermum erythrorhizon]
MATELPSLKAQLPGSKLVFIDIYSLLEVIIQKPQSFGFSYVDKGCCGTGYIEVAFLCNPTTSTCPDVDKHFFWDSFHPSQQELVLQFFSLGWDISIQEMTFTLQKCCREIAGILYPLSRRPVQHVTVKGLLMKNIPQ